MIEAVVTSLLFAPTRQYVEATIVPLTPEMIETQLSGSWWTDPSVKSKIDPPPIDRLWDWNAIEIEIDSRILASEKVAIIASEGAVQGSMLISIDPVLSMVQTDRALFIELLFTAPWNRRRLRKDGRSYIVGVGSKMLAWGAWLSRELGQEGRLRLDSSPDFVSWYLDRGLQKLNSEPIVFENVAYEPMELSTEATKQLFSDFERQG